MKPLVLLGFLGTQLDAADAARRWDRWRPTVSLFQHEDFLIHRLELFHEPRDKNLAQQVLTDIESISPETELREHTLALQDPWDFESVFATLHDFAGSYDFEPEEEDYLVHITTGSHVAQICLFLLTESRHFPARLIQSAPPTKRTQYEPRYQIIDLDLSRYDRIAERFKLEQAEGVDYLKSGIPTRNAAFNHQIELIEKVALASTAPVLLMGPTGAGKSSLAGRIYELRRQRMGMQGPFVEVNCATLRGDSAMSALFGHRKGAFTGASSDRGGLLREADGGLLFLDEIGELGADEQAMLLRAVEARRFLPLGSDQEVASDFQLIAGTNRDLRQRVHEGLFREDLLARIDLWTFELPGLENRLEDLPPNLDYELQQFTARSGQRARFNKEAREAYLDFACSPKARWVGNFRDLSGSVTRMATLAPAGRIRIDEVRDEIARLRRAWQSQNEKSQDEGDHRLEALLGPDYRERYDDFDLLQLERVVVVCAASPTLSEAGRRLFAVSRTRKRSSNDADRLRKYLARFDLDFAAILS